MGQEINELQKGRDSGDKIRLYIGAGTLGILIIFITWIFGAGKLVSNVQKLPDIERRVQVLEISACETRTELSYIRKGVERIERKLDK